MTPDEGLANTLQTACWSGLEILTQLAVAPAPEVLRLLGHYLLRRDEKHASLYTPTEAAPARATAAELAQGV